MQKNPLTNSVLLEAINTLPEEERYVVLTVCKMSELIKMLESTESFEKYVREFTAYIYGYNAMLSAMPKLQAIYNQNANNHVDNHKHSKNTCKKTINPFWRRKGNNDECSTAD